MISPMVGATEARCLLGVSRSLWDKIRLELHAYQYTPGGKLFYKRSEIEAYIERKRKPQFVQGRLMNPEIESWFK